MYLSNLRNPMIFFSTRHFCYRVLFHLRVLNLSAYLISSLPLVSQQLRFLAKENRRKYVAIFVRHNADQALAVAVVDEVSDCASFLGEHRAMKDHIIDHHSIFEGQLVA
mmetsp:Transcript_28415/g.50019  ORF Transcript_28415/g.50019 Transcript_28415/m.50019 type:complete len:109 (-) Transcript_28415:793-1119(-)